VWYQRGKDHWVDEAWWVNLARRWWHADHDQRSALILLTNGDDEPRPTVLEQFRQYEAYDPEVFDECLVWFLRSELPWPLDQDGPSSFPRVLGSPPPEFARRIALRVRRHLLSAGGASKDAATSSKHLLDALDTAADLDTVSAMEWLEPAEIEQLHQACRDWASRDDDYHAFWNEKPLQAAANLRWTEILDLLDQNPALAPAVLQWDATRMTIGNFAQRLTLIRPGPLAARFAAFALTMNLEEEAEEILASMFKACGEWLSAETKASSRKNHMQGLRLQQLAGAIAWRRCQHELSLS